MTREHDMRSDPHDGIEPLEDLFATVEAATVEAATVEAATATPGDRAAIRAAWDALDTREDPMPGKEEWQALRTAVLLAVAPGAVDKDIAAASAAVEALKAAPVSLPGPLRARVLDAIGATAEPERSSPLAAARSTHSLDSRAPWTVRDELLWASGGGAVAAAVVAMGGFRPAFAAHGATAVWGPVAFFALAALVGAWLVGRRGPGAVTGALALALASVGAVAALWGNAASATSSPSHDLGCLAVVGLTGLALSAPFALRTGGLAWGRAAALGVFGGLFGALAVHLECPNDHAGHYAGVHALGLLAAGMGAAALSAVRARFAAT